MTESSRTPRDKTDTGKWSGRLEYRIKDNVDGVGVPIHFRLGLRTFICGRPLELKGQRRSLRTQEYERQTQKSARGGPFTFMFGHGHSWFSFA